jgi:PAS domain S-box-containing protein
MKNNHYEKFFLLSTELLCIIDVQGYFILVNPAFSTLLGYTQQELASRPYTHFIHPDDQEITLQQGQRLVMGERVQNFEVRYLTKEQKIVWLSWTSTTILDGYFYATAKDVTQRKEAEQSLLTSEKKFRSLVQNGYEIISIIGPEGTYKYHSDSVYRLLGYPPDELIGLKPSALVHPEDIEKVQKAMMHLQTSPYLNNGIPYRVKAADGTYRWLESSGSNMIDDPAIRGVVVNSRDVTEKVLLQQELHRQAMRQEKEMALSMMRAQEKERTWLGQELHDNINQMLASVKLYIECMQADKSNREALLPKSRQIVQGIVEEVRKLSHRLVLPEHNSFDLKQSIEDLACDYFTTSGTAFQLQIEGLQPDSFPKDFKVVIYRIIQEQFTNIIKYAGASQTTVLLKKVANRIELIISDNGKGFDPLVKRAGIGLSNIASRARAFAGITHIHAALGKGCQLMVSFPDLVEDPLPDGKLLAPITTAPKDRFSFADEKLR